MYVYINSALIQTHVYMNVYICRCLHIVSGPCLARLKPDQAEIEATPGIAREVGVPPFLGPGPRTHRQAEVDERELRGGAALRKADLVRGFMATLWMDELHFAPL